MKKLYTIIAAILLTATTFAQAPEKMSYQAVVRDSGDALVANQVVGMQISILQTTATGTAVYGETHTPTTNANGLVTLEIGTGTVSIGDFTTIDWSSGPYFIKTETDPAGGTNYSITGTSQLLSVPYALHAKTASSATETQTLADVVALGNSANNNQLKNVTDPSDAQDAATKAYVDGLDTDDADSDPLNEIQNIEEVLADGNDANGAVITGLGTPTVESDAATKAYIDLLQEQIEALNTRIAALEPAEIGDFRDGGVVFWVDPEDNTHGLVCAIEDQSSDGIRWYNGIYMITGATGETIGTGADNTDTIIAVQGETESDYAAGLARAYTGGGFNDWFLPSKEELNEMYLNRDTINETATNNEGSNFIDSSYWSSTEVNSNYAWLQGLVTGNQLSSIGKYYPSRVRAVRVF
ncbi:hypothetical protein [Flavivirga jejuensis]|uniref:DUF1566 domain-containing protein n=1 Tax=Flavivirga jejuensis TaxID=870487 RepID=A0ABT8WU47_9FLAO|nr:hypothetical protein [Flavivirga jejuensis]MDO5976700.1 hypothetical protein [Flavivirga jejuensis]